ncbi:hypothetical protein Tco_0667610, partial [Tanacetum coccineum]
MVRRSGWPYKGSGLLKSNGHLSPSGFTKSNLSEKAMYVDG